MNDNNWDLLTFSYKILRTYELPWASTSTPIPNIFHSHWYSYRGHFGTQTFLGIKAILTTPWSLGTCSVLTLIVIDKDGISSLHIEIDSFIQKKGLDFAKLVLIRKLKCYNCTSYRKYNDCNWILNILPFEKVIADPNIQF